MALNLSSSPSTGLTTGLGGPLLQSDTAQAATQAVLKNKKVQQLVKNDPNLQRQLLSDPASALLTNKELRDAVLADPELLKALKLDGILGPGGSVANLTPEQVAAKLKDWTSDPANQQKVKSMAIDGIKGAGSLFKKYVQEGPAGIRFLCFVSGCVTSTVGILGLVNIFQILFSPFGFVLNIYVAAFGLITIAIEADRERFAALPFLEHFSPLLLRAQKALNEEAKFLTTLLGRGGFYVFVGILMASDCQLCLFFLSGAFNVVMGVLLIMLHFGIEPDIDWLEAQAASAYNQVPQSNDPATFANAAGAWKESKHKSDSLLKALHTQATIGDITQAGPRPVGLFNASAKADWDAHAALQGVSREEATGQFLSRCRMKGVKF